MKIACFLLIFSTLALFISGCSEDVERENPLDVQNQRTGGAPPGLTAKAGDGQVAISWPNLGFEGIKEFRIYRAHIKPDNFQFVNSVPAKPLTEVSKYVYVDKGLQNDGENVYFYRVSYVDNEDREIPDLKEPKNLPVDWWLVKIIPSLAPPIPEVKVMEDSDLKVRLIWEGYSKSAPPDLAGFKVYSALKAEEGQEQMSLELTLQIDDPKVEFFIDGNDYPRNYIRFRKDGISRLYKVAAFDKAGVESDSPILVGTCPNLPPSPPAQITGWFNFGLNNYEVRLEWRRNLEPDIVGYKVYALLPDGTKEFKEWKREPNETVSTILDSYVVVDSVTVPKQYFVTAYDNSPKMVGNEEKTDESNPSDIVSGM